MLLISPSLVSPGCLCKGSISSLVITGAGQVECNILFTSLPVFPLNYTVCDLEIKMSKKQIKITVSEGKQNTTS